MTVSSDEEKLFNKIHNPFTGGNGEQKGRELSHSENRICKKSLAPAGPITMAIKDLLKALL